MGDWYMENGEYAPHVGDMAYDYDNGAWVEMGSTPGSTPVWWRKHHGSDYGYSRELTPEEKAELEERKAQRKAQREAAQKEVERLEAELADAEKALHLLEGDKPPLRTSLKLAAVIDLAIFGIWGLVDIAEIQETYLALMLCIVEYYLPILGFCSLGVYARHDSKVKKARAHVDALADEIAKAKRQLRYS